MMERKRVAIVGSGVSGLGALWALKSTPHEVHLFEASSRIGGHTNTVPFTVGGHTTPVDSGFIVMNAATYRSPPLPSISSSTHYLTSTPQQTSSPSSPTSPSPPTRPK